MKLILLLFFLSNVLLTPSPNNQYWDFGNGIRIRAGFCYYVLLLFYYSHNQQVLQILLMEQEVYLL